MTNENFTLRDDLAIKRTSLANERTLLAYQRTAIMIFIAGMTILKLFENMVVLVFLGIAFIPLSVLIAVFSYIRFVKIRDRIGRDVREEGGKID
jgi:putative membrane protein